MGLFKNIRQLSKMSKEIAQDFDPAAQMRDASNRMQQMTKQNELLTTGTQADATVVALRETGMEVNLQPVLEVDLTVFPAAGVPFPSTATTQGHAHIAMLTPGATIRVRDDPADPSTVVIG